MGRWAHTVTTEEELALLFGSVGAASLHKEVAYVHPNYRALIEASPFCVLATSGPGGLDASPRGDAPGFVVVEDEKTLLIPDRRGNNRIDSLRNLIADPRVALLFLIPGRAETLRVNGRAILRSHLWDPARPDAALPSAGQILAALSADAIDGAAYDRELPERQCNTLY